MPISDPGLAVLVERQMRNWELARSQRLATPDHRRQEVEDFICVSRMVGLDARPVSGVLGQRLGWPVFGREILDAMAGDDTIRRQIYASMDERDLSWWERVIRPVIQSEFVRDDYFHRLCDTLLTLARQAPAVFQGRGADLVLSADRGFRVRLVASLETRIRSHAGQRGVGQERARQEISEIERERSEFFRHHFRIDPTDPVRHDLAINLDRFTAEQAVELILIARAKRGLAG